MPKIELFLNKTPEQNASLYYEKAKKAKKKLAGAKQALEKTQKELKKAQKEKQALLKKLEKPKAIPRKKEWFEKFHWFYSSEGFLCLGGRDATSNEIIIKKYTDKDDLVLHTDMAGSPFFVIKNGQNASEPTLKQAAQATASYSKAWKLGLAYLDVFYVKPEQVSKKTKSGEFMPKGAFMIYGKTNYLSPKLEIAIGLKNNQIIGGPTQAISTQTNKYLIVIPGREKTSALAKKIKAKIGGDLDEIIRFLPAGGCALK